MKKFILLCVCCWAISLTSASSLSQPNLQTETDTVIVVMPGHCVVVTDQNGGWQFYQEADSIVVSVAFYTSSIQKEGDYTAKNGDIITDATSLNFKNAGGEMTQEQLTDIACSLRLNATQDTISFTAWMTTEIGRMYEVHMAYYKPEPKDTVDITIDNCNFSDGRETNDAWSLWGMSEDKNYFVMISPRGDSLEGRWEKDYMFTHDEFHCAYQAFYIITEDENGYQSVYVDLMDGWLESYSENYNLVAEAEFLCSNDIYYRFHLSASMAFIVSVRIGVDALCKDMGRVVYENAVYHQGDTITIVAEAESNCYFTQWSDGNTDNPRTIVLTQDTTIKALFAPIHSGTCGDALYWVYEDSTLTITGLGTMYDYSYSNIPWRWLRDSICSLSIGEQVESIGKSAFRGCYKLDAVSIPNSVTSIGDLAFDGCSSLSKLVCEGHVETIYTDILRYNYALDTVVISAQAFDVVANDWPYMPKNIRYIKVTGGELTDNAFNVILHNYKVLNTLDLAAATNTTLSDEAFKGCYNLQTLSLPSELTAIPYMSVAECVNLQSVIIPASVTDIEQRAFENCRSLSDVTFEDGIALERIGSWAFYNCHDLQSIVIPEGVTEIGNAAFYGCNYLQDLTLSSTLRKIGDNTFALCSKLQRMHVSALVPPTAESKTFLDVLRTIPVIVPDEAVEDYKAAAVWQEFNIIGESNAPMSIETTRSTNAQGVQKQLRDGQVLIIRNGETYDMMGQRL